MQKTRRKMTPEEQKQTEGDMIEAFAAFAPMDGEGDGAQWLLDDFGEDDLRAAWMEVAEQNKKEQEKKGKRK